MADGATPSAPAEGYQPIDLSAVELDATEAAWNEEKNPPDQDDLVTSEKLKTLKEVTLTELRQDLFEKGLISAQTFEGLQRQVEAAIPENSVEKTETAITDLLDQLTTDIKSDTLWLLMKNDGISQANGFTVLFVNVVPEEAVMTRISAQPKEKRMGLFTEAFIRNAIAFYAVIGEPAKANLRKKLTEIMTQISDAHPTAERLQLVNSEIHVFSEAQDLGAVDSSLFSTASQAPSTQPQNEDATKAPTTPEQTAATETAARSMNFETVRKRIEAFAQTKAIPLADLENNTPGFPPEEKAALVILLAHIKKTHPGATHLKCEGEEFSVQGADSSWVKVDLTQIAPTTSTPEHTNPSPTLEPLSEQKKEAAILKLITYLADGTELPLGKDAAGVPNIVSNIALFQTNSVDIVNVLTGIKTQYPNAIALKYENNRFQVQQPGNQQNPEPTWTEIKVGMTAAQTYLNSLENFDRAIEEKKQGSWLYKIAEMLFGLFKMDLKELIRDQGGLGPILRMAFSLEPDAKDQPINNRSLNASLEKLIQQNTGESIDGTWDAQAQKDTKANHLLGELGKRFNTPKGKVQLVESSVAGITAAAGKDAENVGETAGSMLLKIADANTSAAIVRYAQRRSSDFLSSLTAKFGSLGGGKFEQLTNGLLKSSPDSTVNKYITPSEKNDPDNIVASSKGVQDGAYLVEVRWFSDGQLETQPQPPAPGAEAPTDQTAQ